MFMVKGSIKDLQEKINEEETTALQACIRDIEQACEGFVGDKTTEEYEALTKALEDVFSKVMAKIQSDAPPPSGMPEGMPPGMPPFSPADIGKDKSATTDATAEQDDAAAKVVEVASDEPDEASEPVIDPVD